MAEHRVTHHASTILYPDDDDFTDFETVPAIMSWLDYFAPISTADEMAEIMPALNVHLAGRQAGSRAQYLGNGIFKIVTLDG